VDSRGYYKLLGVSPDSSQEDIKKAFRKLSMQYHPDKNPDNKEAEEHFKEINEAYSVISDPERRQQYDNPGIPGFNFQSFGFGGAMGDYFNRVVPNFQRQRRRNMPRKGRDLMYIIDVPISEFILGGKEEFSVEFDDMCNSCSGKGYKSSKTCPNCDGSGMIVHVQSGNGMHMQTSSPCGACRGSGEIGTEGCPECNGLGHVKAKRDYVIDIAPGSRDGDVMKQDGLGGIGMNGGPPGDLVVKLRMRMPRAEDLSEEQKEILVDLFV